MKLIPLVATLWILSLICFLGSPSSEFQKALDETGVEDRPVTPTLGELAVDPFYVKDMKKLPADRKRKLADQLTKLIPKLAQERFAQPPQPIQRDVRPVPMGESPKLGILILQEIGTDEQKIEALRDLNLYGDSLYDACQALSTCEGAEGVRILKQYAESQIPNLESGMSPPTSGQVPPLQKFGDALMALQGAYHSDGPAAASTLFDKFTSILGDKLTKKDFVKIKKDLGEASQRRENLIREMRPYNKRNPKPESINTASSTDSDPSSQAISSKIWFWPVVLIAAALFGLACWKWIWIR